MQHKLSQSPLDLVTVTHLREVLRYIADASQLELITAGDYIAITTSAETAGFNFILGIGENSSDFLPLIEYFKKYNRAVVRFSYPLTPELEHTLTRQGFYRIGPLTCVAYELSQYISQEEDVNKNFAFVPVVTETMFQSWCKIVATTWNHPVNLAVRFFSGLNPEQNPQSRPKLFLVQKEFKYVGCSLLDIQEDIAGCYWDCVLPEFRKQGIGHFMIQQKK